MPNCNIGVGMPEKKVIVFDLDGTLAESKSPMTLEMAELLEELLKKYSVAVISGGAYPQFQTQFLGSLPLPDELLDRLFLFPTCATSFYKHENKTWARIYSQDLTAEEKKKILDAFALCFEEVGFIVPKKPQYGQILEDRGTQITFSALGQQAPLTLKKKWDPKHLKRLEMIEILQQELPEFSIRSGGSTSIDITKAQIDKAYGIRQIEKYLGSNIKEIFFIGDQIESPIGNDYPIKSTGVDYFETSGPAQTMDFLTKNFI